MTNLTSLDESSYGIISKRNFTTTVNSSYSITYEAQVCSIPSQVADNAAVYMNGQNLVLMQYSYVCMSIKCSNLNQSQQCTDVRYRKNGFNRDNIG